MWTGRRRFINRFSTHGRRKLYLEDISHRQGRKLEKYPNVPWFLSYIRAGKAPRVLYFLEMTKKNKKLGRKYINHKKAVKGRRCCEFSAFAFEFLRFIPWFLIAHGRNTPIDAREVKIDVSNNLPFTSKHFLLGTMKWWVMD